MGDQQTFKIRSSIKRELKESRLKRGGLLGGLGAVFLVTGGTIVPLAQLKIWGVPIFFLSLLFIGIGLYPYRQLCRLEVKPHSLSLIGALLLFEKSGRPLFKIPISVIDHFAYVEQEELYGIALYLKRPLENKLVVLDHRFDCEAFISDSATHFEGCDLFLPYFSQRSYEELKLTVTCKKTG